MIDLFKKDKSKEPKSLKEVMDYVKSLEQNIEELSFGFQNLKKIAISSFQKVGIVRYSPFENTGGDQSFSIAILDANDTGFVLTSFYSREGTRVFAKPIKGGKSEYTLSEEEVDAIKKAQSAAVENK